MKVGHSPLDPGSTCITTDVVLRLAERSTASTSLWVEEVTASAESDGIVVVVLAKGVVVEFVLPFADDGFTFQTVFPAVFTHM